MIGGIDLHNIDIDADVSPEGPSNDEKYRDDEQRYDDFHNYPYCAFPTGLIVIPLVERSCDRLQYCQVAH